MSDLFSMLISAHIEDSTTGEIVGVVTGIDTMGNRMRVKAHIFDLEEIEEEDDPEKEDIPEPTINEKIAAIAKERNK